MPKTSEELRDNARFRAALKTVRQFAEQGDLKGLRTQVGNLHEQYEITKLTLSRATADVSRDGFVESLGVLQSLQQRMMYVGFLQAYVQQRTGERSTPSIPCESYKRTGCRSIR
ncbi:hypothetical protein N5938_02850 [Pseudomonas aeruginosa]|uniref:hypothetical protein n=1 Tax=Pseudomonas aeruginosa TaxID=287 RepID=UPI0021F0F357|nr:hypothetical protein [Pseudomonas aeruginosa]UYM61891.1 hypothetical protein N5938_02850 [Pseudomonas aeruginosa]